jgi:apolipoprotein N-acyltransferase
MVRCDGRAFSQLVDSFGGIVAEAPPGDRVLSGVLSAEMHWTVYKAIGDWFLLVCAGLALAGWFINGQVLGSKLDGKDVLGAPRSR